MAFSDRRANLVGRGVDLVTEVVNGAAANTNIAVAGVKPADELQSVVMYAAGVPSNVTSEARITSAGNIQLTTTNSTNNTLVVTYWSV